MTNPVSMALGPYAFEAIGFHYDGLSRSVNTSWSDIEVAQRRNAQQWLGPTSDEVTIKGVLFPFEFGGQDSLDGVISAAEAGEPMMFVAGDAAAGMIYGYHTIQGVEEDRSFIDRAGIARRNAYQIKLKRYDGEVDASGVVGSLLSLLG
ncbi:MAG: phage tail protein [Bosea sp.]|nr:phage tail protein [Bosea sp. (in: a-proteobacteria)]